MNLVNNGFKSKGEFSQVFLIIGAAEIGGAELQLMKHAEKLKELNIRTKIVFLSMGSGELFSKYQMNHFDIVFLSRSSKKFSKRYISVLLKVIKLSWIINSCKPVVVNSYLIESILVSYFSSYFVRQTKFLLSLRGEVNKMNWIYKFFFRRAIIKSSYVIFNSSNLVDSFKSDLKSNLNKIKVVQNGVQQNEVNLIDYNCNKSVYLANFIHYKGHMEFLKAYKDSAQEMKINFYGDGEFRRSSIDFIEESGIGDLVTVTSTVINPITELVKFGFAIHPSFTEGLCNAILEEMSVGLAVIAFNVGGNSELISHEENGYLVELGDYKSFFKYMNMLYKDSQLRNKLGRAAFESAKRFSWDINTKKMVDIYRLGSQKNL